MTEIKEKSFLSNAAMYGIGSILLQAASIILLPLYLNCLSPEEYGVLEILNRVGTFVVIGLMANGIRMATLTFYQQCDEIVRKQQVVANVLLLVSALIVIGILLSVVVAPYLAWWLELSNARMLTFGVITVLLEALFIVPLVLMQARIQSVRYVSVSLAMFLIRVLLTIYLLMGLEMGIWGILIARSLVAVIFSAIFIWAELRGTPICLSWQVSRDILHFSLPFLPGGFLAFFINNGDRFFLMKFEGEYQVGVYSVAYRIATAVSMFGFIPLYKVWSAKMYGMAEVSNAPKVFGLVFTYFLTSLLCAGLGVTLFAGDILSLLGGGSYNLAIELVPILTAAIVLMSLADLMDSGLYVTRKTRFKPYIFLVTGVVILLSYSFLIPAYAGRGAAWATLIGFACHALLTQRITQKIFYVDYQWMRIAILVLATMSCGLLGLSLANSRYAIAAKLGAFLAWVIILYRLASPSEREHFRALMKPLLIFQRGAG